VDSGSELQLNITNISHGGISMSAPASSTKGGAARLRFQLPGSKRSLEIKGEIVWSTPEGSGRHSLPILSAEAKDDLDSWLEKRALH